MIKQFRECVEKWGLREGLTEEGKVRMLNYIDRGFSANELSRPFIYILIECAAREGLREEALAFAEQNDSFRFIHGPLEEK